MEALVPALIFALLLIAYLAWRLYANIKRMNPIQTEVNVIIYLALFLVMQLIGRFVRIDSREVSGAFLLVWLAASFTISFFIQRRYNRWVEKRRQAEEEAERRQTEGM